MEIDAEEGEISGAPGSFTVALPGDVPSPPACTFCRSHAHTVKVDIQAIPLLCVIAADFFSLFFLPPCLSPSWDISTSDRYTRRSARGSPVTLGPGQSSVRPAHSPTSSPRCMDPRSRRQRRATAPSSLIRTIYPFSINW